MQKKAIWLAVSFLMVLSLVMASCGPKEEEVTPTEEEEEVTVPAEEEEEVIVPREEEEGVTPVGGNWWDYMGEPEYGGTLTIRVASSQNDYDPYNFADGAWMDGLGGYDWDLDRDIYDFRMIFVPAEYLQDALVESWEVEDSMTITLHIRKGVHWHDKPPVNGREFTAYDVEYHYHRLCGIGSGFTEPSPRISANTLATESVTATDKYTVVYKFKTPSLDRLHNILYPNGEQCMGCPKEAIELWGDVNAWEHTIGTGPFILTDVVEGSSATYVKNSNYWAYDERHPENKLPYADKLKELVIPDMSMAIAALRTGKIDIFPSAPWGGINWEQAASLAKTNPELVQAALLGAGWALEFRCDNEPFTDIRVRTAMQMAMDLPTIAKSYYGGTVEGTPYGLVGPAIKGYYLPFDEWPEELQEEYTYNSEGAKKLLAEAGYPEGFKTNVIVSSTGDLNLMQVLKAYLLDIDVDMEIRVLEGPAFSSMGRTRGHDQMAAATDRGISPYDPIKCIARGLSTYAPANWSNNNDPVFDAMYYEMDACLDEAEYKRLCVEADQYALRKHWRVYILPIKTYTLYQPWLKGYTGELFSWGEAFFLTRLWIDQDLKKSMGY